jgi:hypothetical protein
MGRRPATAAAFAVALFVVGQIAASAHEASTRHVVCPEHGEQLEAVTLAGTPDRCEHSHWTGIESHGGGAHDECVIVSALHQSSVAPRASQPLSIVTRLSVDATTSPALVVLTFERYRIAPKTSPPVVG